MFEYHFLVKKKTRMRFDDGCTEKTYFIQYSDASFTGYHLLS